MAERNYLSELEHLVLLSVLRLGDAAYGAAIQRDLEENADRGLSVATIYVALTRLEKHGLVRSWMSDPEPVRGGRARRLYAVEADGVAALESARSVLERMWSGVHPATLARGS